MLRPRLMPVLLLKDGKVVKGTRFQNHKYVGDLINTIKIFNEKAVDEIVILDISGDQNENGPDLALIEAAASEAFVPLSYGGGVRSLETAARIISLGVEKVVFSQVGRENRDLLFRFVQEFGSSSVVACLNFDENFNVQLKDESGFASYFLPEILSELMELGVGEFLLQDISREGTKEGPRQGIPPEIIAFAKATPVIYSGGVASLEHCVGLWRYKFDVAAGSWFVHQGRNNAVLISYPPLVDRRLAAQASLASDSGSGN